MYAPYSCYAAGVTVFSVTSLVVNGWAGLGWPLHSCAASRKDVARFGRDISNALVAQRPRGPSSQATPITKYGPVAITPLKSPNAVFG